MSTVLPSDSPLTAKDWLGAFKSPQGLSKSLSDWKAIAESQLYKENLKRVEDHIQELKPQRVLLIETLHKTGFGDAHSLSFIAETDHHLIYYRVYPYEHVAPQKRVVDKNKTNLENLEEAVRLVNSLSGEETVALGSFSREWIGGRYSIFTPTSIGVFVASSGYSVANGRETAFTGPVEVLKKLTEIVAP